jgi:hypothetical protein
MLRKRISDLSWYARAHRDMSSNLIERMTFVHFFVSILVRNNMSEAENKCVGICTYCRSRRPQTDLPGDRRIMAALHLCDISAQQCCKKRVYNVYRCSIYWTRLAEFCKPYTAIRLKSRRIHILADICGLFVFASVRIPRPSTTLEFEKPSR